MNIDVLQSGLPTNSLPVLVKTATAWKRSSVPDAPSVGLSAGGGTAVLVHTYGGARANHANRTSEVEFGARDALKER